MEAKKKLKDRKTIQNRFGSTVLFLKIIYCDILSIMTHFASKTF